MTHIQRLIELGEEINSLEERRLSLQEAADCMAECQNAIVAALPDLKAMEWKYVDRDGLPEDGYYEVSIEGVHGGSDRSFLFNSEWLSEDDADTKLDDGAVYAYRNIAPKAPQE